MVDLVLVVANAVVITITFVAIIVVYAARYKRVPPNHAMIVFGRRYAEGSRFHIVTAGGRFIQPIIEAYALLPLAPFRTDLTLERIPAGGSGRLATASVTAMAKVPDRREDMEKAARRFVSGNEPITGAGPEQGRTARRAEVEMRRFVSTVLESHSRGIFATLLQGTEDGEFARRLRAEASGDLGGAGLEILSVSASVRVRDHRASLTSESDDAIRAELDGIDARLRRVEVKLGLS